MEQLINFLKAKEVSKVLDVGTGSGDFITVIREAVPDADITGVDPDISSLEKAMEAHPGVKFKVMKGEKLEFKAGSFDLVTLSMALHHLSDVGKTLDEMRRVVRPGGHIVVNELFSDNLNPAQEVHKFFHHFRSKTDRLKGISHNETFKKDEIIGIVRDSGVEIETFFEYLPNSGPSITDEGINERVEKMKEMLESVKNFPEYDALKGEPDKFIKMARKHGFQSATRIVVIGRPL